MQITKFEVKRLHGTLTKDVDFQASLNLVVGINGSGKTSILNCISWLLKPDFGRLCTTQFQSMRLLFLHESKRFEIKVTQKDDLLVFELEEGGVPVGNSIKVALIKPPARIKDEVEAGRLRFHYEQLGPEKHEVAVWRLMDKLPEPLFISLERTISAESEGVSYVDPDVRIKVDKSPKSPLMRVSDVTRAKYAAYREKMNSLNESLKSKIVLLAFQDPFGAPRRGDKIDVTIEDVQALEAKLSALLFSSLGSDAAVSQTMKEYFDQARHYLRYGNDKDVVSFFNLQFRQIYGLAEEFKDFEKNASSAYEPIGSYLNALNSFFRESGKVIGFNDQDGTLGFRFLGHTGKPSGAYLPVDRLSSGEKQIIILLTFLAFIARRRHVFIIDEPELSLHPHWQRSFVAALLSQAPEGAQVVLATHSPEIVARHRDFCVVLDV